MIKAVSFTLIAAATVLASPVRVQGPPSAEQAKTERPICRIDAVTGSRARKQKVCLPQREGDRRKRNAKGFVEELDRDRETTINPIPTGG